MIRHMFLLDLPQTYDRDELAAVMAGLAGLQDQIKGFLAFAHGPNRDLEGMSPDCAYAFTCDFDGPSTSQAYLVNPDHQTLGARLVALCRGGARGITVIDMEVAQ